MITTRSSLMVGAMLVAVMVAAAVHVDGPEHAAKKQKLMQSPAVSGLQSVRFTDKVGDLLVGAAPEERRLRVFVNSLRVLTRSGSARERCVCVGERSTDGVCRQMGELLLRQQVLEREGRKPQVAAFLNRVREARASGMPEAQVRSMVRSGVANGELSLSAESECRSLRHQIDELNRKLVAGEMLATGESSELVQVSAR